MEHRVTQPYPASPTSSTNNAFLIPLQDAVLGDVRLSAEENSLSVNSALEDGQRWEDDRFWKEYAQPLVKKEDTQPMFEDELRFLESAPHDTECSRCICGVCLANTRDCIISPCKHRVSCYACTIQLKSCRVCKRPIKNIFRFFPP